MTTPKRDAESTSGSSVSARAASRRRRRGPRPPGEMPRTPDALHAWLAEHLEVRCPREALMASSTAPFDYLVHTFFEGRGAAPGAANVATGAMDLTSGGAGAAAGVEPARGVDCVVWANRGGGKTFLGAVATLLDLCFKPGVEVRILGGSLEQSSRMYEHLRGFFERPALKRLLAGRATRRAIVLRNGSRAQVLAQSEAAVRGTRVQKLRCDEVDLFDPEIWRAAQLTTRSIQVAAPWGGWVRGSIEALSTMHRPMGLMWEIVGSSRRAGERAAETGDGPRATRTLFRWGVVDALESCPAARACAGCALEPECAGRAKDRPAEHAGHITIDDAIALKARVSAAEWGSEMLCLRPTRGHAVFPEFDPAVHVVSPSALDDGPRAGGATLVCGMDFGFRAPTVVLWARHSPDGTLRVVAERSVVKTRLEEHVRAIVEGPLGVPAWVGIDPAGAQREMQTGRSSADVLRGAGLVVHSRQLGLHAGLNLVRARLDPASPAAPARVGGEGAGAAAEAGSGPRLLVSSACPVLIESLTRYHYDPARPESLEPVKDGSDHAVDALRYLVVALDRPHASKRGDY